MRLGYLIAGLCSFGCCFFWILGIRDRWFINEIFVPLCMVYLGISLIIEFKK